ncbi:hypothetical protein GUITHDRAFT_105473 [Guillardia theta CCMP2712]|uniref:RING-type domain-containing protein n=1 Tax=Guillardia theta (strain CCMP2712) TaxID=905079 RepID=L1JL31_GUITC|nr:hypothetical protein GUITHDRAFT_105473 [Guillardia theta CCMP2712]EKX48849.1 hypothetical protein GUITHDRAFT_105473 [Guillardia theta CCMP2712]|eukprot:XP_005835829.1 hypothetical protein GUITHDRAFT_105473 [Guillardia theta CCMP2712]
MTIQDDNAAQALIQLFSGEGLKTTKGSRAGRKGGKPQNEAMLQPSVRRGGRKRKPSSRLDGFSNSDHEACPSHMKDPRVKRGKVDEVTAMERKRSSDAQGTARITERKNSITDCESDNSTCAYLKKSSAMDQKTSSRRASPISQASTPLVSPMPSPVESASSNKYCHFCQHVKVKRSTSMLSCSQCDRRYCEYCLRVHLNEIWERSESWSCPRCRCKCCCNSVSCTKLHRHCKAYRYRLLRAKQAELRATSSPRDVAVQRSKKEEGADEQQSSQDPRGWLELQAVVSSVLEETGKKVHHANFVTPNVKVEDRGCKAGAASNGSLENGTEPRGDISVNSVSMLLCSDEHSNRSVPEPKFGTQMHKLSFPKDLAVSNCVATKHSISSLLTV